MSEHGQVFLRCHHFHRPRTFPGLLCPLDRLNRDAVPAGIVVSVWLARMGSK
jgi:hypothetical protein